MGGSRFLATLIAKEYQDSGNIQQSAERRPVTICTHKNPRVHEKRDFRASPFSLYTMFLPLSSLLLYHFL